jgi:serine/threonine-protein kinase
MSTDQSPDERGLSWSDLKAVDLACERFESAWQAFLARQGAGDPPRVEDFLGVPTPTPPPGLLRELLRLDCEYRGRLGQRPTPEEYQSRFPGCEATIRSAFATASTLSVRGSPADADTTPALPLEVTLIVLAGPDLGHVAVFAQPGKYVVGRYAGADLNLGGDHAIGRMHFLVELRPPLCRLLDMASRNGVSVNGQRALAADLRDGDRIECGRTVLEVRIREGVAPPPLPAEEEASVAPERPDRFPGYHLEVELGRGGMGVVYRARRVADGLPVALKTLHPDRGATAPVVERFLREASILCNLAHPNVVAFHDLGFCAGDFFFVMELVPGVDLGRLVRKGGAPLTVERAMGLACQVLDALAYAHGHSRQFVHRDVKPRNVLVATGGDGREAAKLTDFGLARLYQASRIGGVTLTGGMGGTLGYMAPEQLDGFHQAGEPADQYGATATLYFLLTARLPYDFPEDLFGRFEMLRREEPVPIRARRPDLPEALAAVIARGLARDPARRFASVAGLREALLRAIERGE